MSICRRKIDDPDKFRKNILAYLNNKIEELDWCIYTSMNVIVLQKW